MNRGRLNRRLFVSTVECVLTYGCEAWALSFQEEKALDGVYKRMLKMALNVFWEDHMRNSELYGNLARLTNKMRKRRMGLVGHCVTHPELAASDLMLWEPTHGRRNCDRGRTTLIDTLKRDTGLNSVAEVRTLMEDPDEWRAAIRTSRVGVS
ncbi:uncharacterized protein [Montipora capricornis]|uniref:uncharacterized protein n=1 Tax=Montipora capricornis TaxID=246305 RepID=UPI0035F2183B